MSTENNKAIAKRFFEQGLNQKNMPEFDLYFSPNVINHSIPPDLPPGIEGRKLFMSTFFNAFPDLHFTIDNLVAEGNMLVARWTSTGKHTGELMGIAPTGKSVTVTGIAIDRFENGRSVENWIEFDQMGLMQQLGVIPAPGTA